MEGRREFSGRPVCRDRALCSDTDYGSGTAALLHAAAVVSIGTERDLSRVVLAGRHRPTQSHETARSFVAFFGK